MFLFVRAQQISYTGISGGRRLKELNKVYNVKTNMTGPAGLVTFPHL